MEAIIGVVVVLFFAGIVFRGAFPKSYERLGAWITKLGGD